MHEAVNVVEEQARGCGFRKEGGLYLMSGGPAAACGKLPLMLGVCPCCGGGIKPVRSWTWVDAARLFEGRACAQENADGCECPLADPKAIGRSGLLWIGEKFYPTPLDYTREAGAMGISRRISAVPKGFEAGRTWVLLAHRKALWRDAEGRLRPNVGDAPEFIGDGTTPGTTHAVEFVPAVFRLFRPDRIEKVVSEDVTDEEVEALLKRGIQPVVVKRAGEQKALPIGGGADE